MQTFVNKSNKVPGGMTTLYFNPEQTKELLRVAGDAGLVLMQHYVAIAHQTNPNMEDEHMAKMLERSAGTVRNTRLTLTKAGWFKRDKTTKAGEVTITYAVGKEAVSQSSRAILIP